MGGGGVGSSDLAPPGGGWGPSLPGGGISGCHDPLSPPPLFSFFSLLFSTMTHL